MSYQKFAKDTIFMGVVQFIPIIQTMVFLPVITKLLGPLNYGIWAQIMVTISLIAPLAALDLPYTLVRFLAGEKNKEEIRDGIWSSSALILLVGFIIAIFFISFSGPISRFLGCPPIFIYIMVLIIIFDCLTQIFLGVFRAFQQTKKYVFFTTSQSIISTLLTIVIIFLGGGLLGAILSLLASRILFFIIVGFTISKMAGIKFPMFSRTKEYLSFGLPGILQNISFWVVQSSDRYLIGFFLGVLFVGYYVPAYALANFISIFAGPISFILPAVMSKAYDENKIDEAKTYLAYSLKYFLALAIPATFGLSSLAKPILSTFSTPEISQHSFMVVPFVATSVLISGLGGLISIVIAIKKKTRIGGIIWLGAALINFIMNLVLIPIFGILGAAITTLLAYAFSFFAIWIYCNKIFPFKIDWIFIFKSIIASILMSMLILLLNPWGLWRTMIAVICGAVVYFALIFILRGFGKNETKFLKELFIRP